MSSRVSLVLLALASAACFSDSTPGGLSTAGTSGGGASATDASTASTVGGPGTTAVDATTAAPTSTGATTGTGTGEATLTTASGTSTTSPGTTGTTDPGTTSTTASGPDSGSTSTSAGDFDACAPTGDKFSCYTCCGEATPDWSLYLEGIAGCSCGMLACGVQCDNSLCDGLPLTEACFTCVAPMAGGRCFSAVDMKCKANPSCAPFYECIEVAQCALKPN